MGAGKDAAKGSGKDAVKGAGKGAEMGAVFGGGASSTVFGSRGAGNFLTKLTTGFAVIFMLTSLSLSYIGTRTSGDQLFEEGVIERHGVGGVFEFCQTDRIDHRA